jgi:hypothetical protein
MSVAVARVIARYPCRVRVGVRNRDGRGDRLTIAAALGKLVPALAAHSPMRAALRVAWSPAIWLPARRLSEL